MGLVEDAGRLLAEARLASGLSQAQVAESLGVSQASVSLLESGRRRADHATYQLLAGLFGKRRVSELLPDSRHVARPGIRRAFICEHPQCVPPRRVFLVPGEPDRVPECERHGRMAVQSNRPYLGQSTV